MKYFIPVILFIATTASYGQGVFLLEMTFDDCMDEDMGVNALDATVFGDPTCVCAPGSDAFLLDEIQDGYNFNDTSLELGLAFTLTFVFRSDDDRDDQRLFSYKDNCTSPQGWDVTYQGSDNTLEVDFFESLTNRSLVELQLDDRRCWHAVSIVKTGTTVIAYLYGEEVSRTQSNTLIDVGDSGNLTIGSGPCVPEFAEKFIGAFDYISLFNEALDPEVIRSTAVESNRILTRDTVLFLGSSLTTSVDAECTSAFQWRPTIGVSNPNMGVTNIAPEESTVYYLQFTDGGCQVEDSIRIIMVDPDDVNCERLILPSAFTPNGDNLNDVYFISNGFAVEELLRFEIFDRWGGRVFSSTTLNRGWDGTYQGETVMPGVYLYKIEFICEGEEQLQTGSFSVLN